jgi:hypothetical protein
MKWLAVFAAQLMSVQIAGAQGRKIMPAALLLIAMTAGSAHAQLTKEMCRLLSSTGAEMVVSNEQMLNALRDLDVMPVLNNAGGDRAVFERFEAERKNLVTALGRYIAAAQDMTHRMQVCSR